MKSILLIASVVFLLQMTGTAQIPEPGKVNPKPVLLKGGTFHIGNGSKITDGYLVFHEGKILEIGKVSDLKEDIPSDYDIINTDSKHIYPGFISTNNILGLSEIESVRSTNDLNETGNLNPNVRSAIAFNTDSRIIPTVRANGVLLTQVTPRGGLVSGQSSVMQLDAWNWEDALVRNNDGIHVNWPKKYNHWGTPNKNIEQQLAELIQFFDDAQTYSGQNALYNLKMEAMRAVFQGSVNLYLHCDEPKDIMEAVLCAKKYAIKKIVVAGGAGSDEIITFLQENKVSVLLKRVNSLPEKEDSPVLAPYELAARLQQSKIPYALTITGDMEAMQTRNLPFIAGTTVTYGVPYESAVESITLAPARILGIDKEYGSLEKGKSATLFVSEGDALDMKTNQVIAAYIDGRVLNLSSPQKDLYEKFSKKLNIEAETP